MVNKSTLLIEVAAMCSAISGCACVADNQGITPPLYTRILLANNTLWHRLCNVYLYGILVLYWYACSFVYLSVNLTQYIY